MSRLSLIILSHTVLTFLGAWALFSFPELDESENDLALQDSAISQLASEAADVVAGSMNSSDPDYQGSHLRTLFGSALDQLPEVHQQSVYIIAVESGAAELALEWHDEIATRVRSAPTELDGELAIAESFSESALGEVFRVTENQSGHRRASCYASSWISTGSGDSLLCVYQVSIATVPPALMGGSFYASLIAFLFSTILIALLIIQLLHSKLSAPLNRLETAFVDLTEGEDSRQTPLLVESCVGCAMSPMIHSFNRMSEKLFYQRRELLTANDQIQSAASELSESKTLLETVVESSPDAVIVSDLHGEILFFNYAGRELFGYGEDEPAPTSIGELFVQEVDAESAHYREYETVDRHERLGVRLDGEQFPSLVMIAPLRYDGIKTNAQLYVIKDISDSRSFREMMVRLDRLSTRGEMAGDVAHEINNYLSIIQGNAELLPMLIASGNEAKIEKRIGAINDTVTRITTFTEGLMNFRDQGSEFSDEFPNQLIHNLLAFLKPQQRIRHAQIELDLDTSIGSVHLFEGPFQQALVNMIYNAADATLENGEDNKSVIRIASEKTSGGTLRISVSDNGPGVLAKARQALFSERFSTKRKGHGIGLVTCARIAEAHNGQISYQDSKTGGACFVLEIPLRQPEPETVIMTGDSSSSSSR